MEAKGIYLYFLWDEDDWGVLSLEPFYNSTGARGCFALSLVHLLSSGWQSLLFSSFLSASFSLLRQVLTQSRVEAHTNTTERIRVLEVLVVNKKYLKWNRDPFYTLPILKSSFHGRPLAAWPDENDDEKEEDVAGFGQSEGAFRNEWREQQRPAMTDGRPPLNVAGWSERRGSWRLKSKKSNNKLISPTPFYTVSPTKWESIEIRATFKFSPRVGNQRRHGREFILLFQQLNETEF